MGSAKHRLTLSHGLHCISNSPLVFLLDFGFRYQEGIWWLRQIVVLKLSPFLSHRQATVENIRHFHELLKRQQYYHKIIESARTMISSFPEIPQTPNANCSLDSQFLGIAAVEAESSGLKRDLTFSQRDNSQKKHATLIKTVKSLTTCPEARPPKCLPC